MPTLPPARYVSELHQWVASGKARALREHQGMSLADVGAQLDVTSQAIQRWETGQRQPRGRNARVYYQFLSDLIRAEEKLTS